MWATSIDTTSAAQRRAIASLLVFAIIIAMSGCSRPLQRAPAPAPVASTPSTHGQVEHVIQPVPENQRYARLAGVVFQPSTPRCDNAKPDYPPALLAQRLAPVTVSALLIVDLDGNVSDVRPLYSEGVPEAFTRATVDAMKAWCFNPLERIVDGKRERLPYSDTYTFEFRQVDGKPVVE